MGHSSGLTRRVRPLMRGSSPAVFGFGIACVRRYCQLNAMMSLNFLKSGEERRFFGLFP
jgi:hypothetical protein